MIKNITKNLKIVFKKIKHSIKNKRRYLGRASEPNLIKRVTEKQDVNKKFKKIINGKIKPKWFSEREIVFILILTSIILLLSVFNIGYLNFIVLKSSITRDTILSIHTGIGAILVGLMFIIAPLILKEGFTHRSFVLFSRSHFFALLIFEVIVYLLSLFIDTKDFSLLWIPIFIIGISTIKSFYEVINISSSDYILKKEESRLFFDEIKAYFLKSLNFQLTKRLANNYLSLSFEKIPEIVNVNPFPPLNKDQYEVFIEDKKGLITDIRLGRLNKLVHYISEKNGIDVFATEDSFENTTDTRNRPEPFLHISGLAFSHTNYHSQKLFYIKKTESISEAEMLKIKNIMRHVFVISSQEDFEKEARDSLIKLKQKCLDAINGKETDNLSEVISFYVKLISAYNEMMSFYGGGFSYDQAKKERGSLFDRIKPIDWITEDVREIFDAAVRSNNKTLIQEVGYLPIQIARESIESKDHYIFQEFIDFSQLLYLKSIEKRNSGDNQIADFMLDRSWRYLKEFSFSYLENDEQATDEYIFEYGMHILKTFQSLIKISIDNKDSKAFGEFISQVKQLFKSLEREYRYDRNEEDSKYKKLDLQRSQMFFGIASWILFLLQKDGESKELQKIYSISKNSLPNGIKELSSLFNSVHNFDVEDFWGWDHWELSLYPEGGVHSIQILEKLEVLFAVKGLELLGGKTEIEIENIHIDPSRDLANLVGGSRSLIATLDSIESSPEDWEFILNKGATDKVEAFKTLLLRAKKSQEKKEAQVKRDTGISHKKVTDFKVNLIENYKKNFPISELFKFYNLYADKTDTSSETHAIGINTLFDKAAFFGKEVGWYIHYSGNDEAFGFGRSMTHGENKKVFEQLKESCSERDQYSFDHIFAENHPDDYIILTTNNAVWRYFEYGKDNYIPKWRQDFPDEYKDTEVNGVLLINKIHIPVFSFFIPDNKKSEVYIINKNKLGSFTHWKPEDKDVELSGVFSIEVLPLDQDSPETVKLLSNPPEWLEEIEDKDAQLKYLQERLVIKVFEKFDYTKAGDFEGYIIEIEKE